MSVVVPSLCSWKCSLTLDHTKVSENGTYAVLFDGSGDSSSFGTRLPDDLFAKCQSDGGDICFTSDSAGSNQIPVEIVTIDATGKTAEIWVSATLSNSSDVTLYVWYASNSGTLTQPVASATFGSQAVWTAVGSMAFVQHYGTTGTLSLSDSSVNGPTVTNVGSVTAGTGKIGGAASFNGGSTYFTVDNNSAMKPATDITYGCWVYLNAQVSWGKIFDLPYRDDGTWNSPFTVMELDCSYDSTNKPTMTVAVAGESFNQPNSYVQSSTLLGTGAWHKLDCVRNSTSGTRTIYFDGAAVGTSPNSDLGNIDYGSSGTFCFGRDARLVAIEYFSGLLDEFRLAGAARSANYIATDYAIQSSTSLVTVGTPQSTTPPLLVPALIVARLQNRIIGMGV